MPKKTKNEPAADVTAGDVTSPASSAKQTAAAARKGAAKARSTSRKTSAKKKASSGAKEKTAAKPSVKAAVPTEPSDADVQLRAYFIAEHRLKLGLPGDSARDWLEAKKQLVEEARTGHSA